MGRFKVPKVDWNEVAKRKPKPKKKDTRTDAEKKKQEAARKALVEAYRKYQAKKGKKK